MITAIITSAITFLSIKITNEAAEKNHKEEARKTQREERKNVYLNFLFYAKMLLDLEPTATEKEKDIVIKRFFKSFIQIYALGSPEIIAEFKKRPIAEPRILENLKELYPIIQTLAANELQGKEIYILANAIASKSNSSVEPGTNLF